MPSPTWPYDVVSPAHRLADASRAGVVLAGVDPIEVVGGNIDRCRRRPIRRRTVAYLSIVVVAPAIDLAGRAANTGVVTVQQRPRRHRRCLARLPGAIDRMSCRDRVVRRFRFPNTASIHQSGGHTCVRLRSQCEQHWTFQKRRQGPPSPCAFRHRADPRSSPPSTSSFLWSARRRRAISRLRCWIRRSGRRR